MYNDIFFCMCDFIYIIIIFVIYVYNVYGV